MGSLLSHAKPPKIMQLLTAATRIMQATDDYGVSKHTLLMGLCSCRLTQKIMYHRQSITRSAYLYNVLLCLQQHKDGKAQSCWKGGGFEGGGRLDGKLDSAAAVGCYLRDRDVWSVIISFL